MVGGLHLDHGRLTGSALTSMLNIDAYRLHADPGQCIVTAALAVTS